MPPRNRAGGYHSRPHRRRERSRATFLWETERVNSTTPHPPGQSSRHCLD